MSRPVDLVLARLPDAKPSGRDRWRCACPAHGGSNRSTLSVGVGVGDSVLLRCWHGCEAADVVAALGLELHDLFPERLTGSPPLKRRGMLSATQAIDVIAFECSLVRLAASNLAGGHTLTQVDLERLSIAAARIGALAVEVRA